jgi:O-antigen/teichoic acid export membrane protein
VINNILFLGTFSYITFYKTARKRGQNLIYFKNLKINKSSLKEFATISSASSILGLYGVFCHLSVRGILASNLGMEKIGIYVPIIAWSGFFSTFFVPALIQYIFPKYGKCATNNEIKTVANDGLRLVSFIILPFVLIIISFSDLLIPLFYSKDFLEATVFLPLHFIGIFFWTWMRVLKQIMIPTGKTKQLVPFAIAESSLYLLVVYLFVDKIGLWSWTLRYSLVPFLLFFSYIIYHIQTINFNIFRKNIFLMLYGLTASSLVYYIVLNIKGLYFMRGIIVLVLILVLYLFMQKREREIAFQYKNQYKNKIKRIFKK